VSKRRRAAFVALPTVLQRRFPDMDDPVAVIRRGEVLVNGAVSSNPAALVRADAAVRLVRPRVLRGTKKLAHALRALSVDVGGLVALDIGAAAGGFTHALLDAGATRVYAVDAGCEQLRGALRADPRVVNLERTNLSQLGPDLLPEPIDLVTMDLSYLAVAMAIGQLAPVPLSPRTQLLVLVKPTFELRTGVLAAEPAEVTRALSRARRGIEAHGWQVVGQTFAGAFGARGAVEVFLHAHRRTGHG
jgi:23S rRNA (cytidine1920-2'-O)/16S rRNA (cytidine1409-2'-O)-methyltransferase